MSFAVHMSENQSLRELYSAACMNLRKVQKKIEKDPQATPLDYKCESGLKELLDHIEAVGNNVGQIGKDLRECLK